MLSPIIQIVNALAYVVGLLIPIAIGLALLAFFWGLIQYIRKPEDKARKHVLWMGLVALFIMVSVWGIIRFAQSALGINGNATSPQNAPYIPTYSGSNAGLGGTGGYNTTGTYTSNGTDYYGGTYPTPTANSPLP